MAKEVCELLWLNPTFEKLKLVWDASMLFCDNKSTISIVNNPTQHYHTKHIEVNRPFIKDKFGGGIICMSFVTTEQEVADALTKSHFRPEFEDFICKLGMLDIFAPTRGNVEKEIKYCNYCYNI